MIIEITGLPGSGKSYLAEQLAGYLTRIDELKDFKIYNNYHLESIFKNKYGSVSKKVFKILCLFFDNVKRKNIYTILTSSATLNEKKLQLKLLIKNYMLHEVAYNIISEKRKSVCLMDEGSLHRIHYLFPVNSPKKNTNLIFQNVICSKNNLVIYLKIDVEDSIKRLDERGWPERVRPHLKKDYSKRNYLTFFQEEQDCILDLYSGKVISINTTCFNEEGSKALDLVKNMIIEHFNTHSKKI